MFMNSVLIIGGGVIRLGEAGAFPELEKRTLGKVELNFLFMKGNLQRSDEKLNK